MEIDYKKSTFFISVFIIIISIIFLGCFILFKNVSYSADCEISGVNIGIDKEMNFTGFNLNNSTIKCDIEGKLPSVILLALGELDA